MNFYFSTGELIALMVLVGFLLGWLISWLLDWVFWRQKRKALIANLHMAPAETVADQPLHAEHANLTQRTHKPASPTAHSSDAVSSEQNSADSEKRFFPNQAVELVGAGSRLALSLPWHEIPFWLPSPAQKIALPQSVLQPPALWLWVWGLQSSQNLVRCVAEPLARRNGHNVNTLQTLAAESQHAYDWSGLIYKAQADKVNLETQIGQAQTDRYLFMPSSALAVEVQQPCLLETAPVADWQAQFDNCQAENSRLKQQVHQYQAEHARLLQLQRQVEQLRADLVSAKSENKELQSHLIAATDQFQQLDAERQQTHATEQLRTQRWQTQRDKDHAEIAVLRQQVHQYQADHELHLQAQRQIEQLRTDLCSATGEGKALHGHLAEAAAQIDQLTMERQQRQSAERARTEQWQAQLEQCQTTITDLEQQLCHDQANAERLHQAEAQTQHLAATLAAVQLEAAALRTACDATQLALQQRDEQAMQRLAAEAVLAQQWQARVEGDAAQIAKLQAQLHHLQQSAGLLIDAQAQVVQLESVLADAQQESTEAQAALTKIQAQHALQLQTEAQQTQAWQEQAAAQQAIITQLKQQVWQHQADHEQLMQSQTQLDLQRATLAAAQQKLAETQSELADARVQLQRMDAEQTRRVHNESQLVQDWQTRTEAHQAKIVELQERLQQEQQQQQQRHSQMQAQIQQLEATLGNERQESHRATMSVETLQAELTGTQAELDQIHDQHTQALAAERQNAHDWQDLAQQQQSAIAALQQQLQQERDLLSQQQVEIDQLQIGLAEQRQRIIEAQPERIALPTQLLSSHEPAGVPFALPIMASSNGNGHLAPVGKDAQAGDTQAGSTQDMAAVQVLGKVAQLPLPRRDLADLIILIDTSRSMSATASHLSEFMANVLMRVQQSSPLDLRPCWLGIEGIWPNTSFTRSYRDYLLELGIANTALVGRRRDTVKNQGAQKDGARAMTDLCQYFDWRQSAARFLLYLGDQALEGSNRYDANQVKAAAAAVATACACDVKVFTYAGAGDEGGRPDVDTEVQYQALAAKTGGQAYIAPLDNLRAFTQDLIKCFDQGANGA